MAGKERVPEAGEVTSEEPPRYIDYDGKIWMTRPSGGLAAGMLYQEGDGCSYEKETVEQNHGHLSLLVKCTCGREISTRPDGTPRMHRVPGEVRKSWPKTWCPEGIPQ